MPGNWCQARNDETTSRLPDTYLVSGLRPHAGPAGASRRREIDPSDAASPQPRNSRVEPSDEKTNHAPNSFLLTTGQRPGMAVPSRRHSYADFDQLSRAATPHTITGPKLPYGAPFGPVMYPSLAIFKMRNSSVRRPRYPFLMASSVHS